MVTIVDAGGYQARTREFTVAGVSLEDLEQMIKREVPLGFSVQFWRACIAELLAKLQEAQLSDADVRIRGSSTEFFSGLHKPFPQSTQAFLRDADERSLDSAELLRLWDEFGYRDADLFPHYHYFDSRCRLGLTPDEPSDYDIQLSSDILSERALAYGKDNNSSNLISDHGGQYKQAYVFSVVPGLMLWSERWVEQTKREVNIAAFSSRGPVGQSAFSTRDWVIVRPSEGVPK